VEVTVIETIEKIIDVPVIRQIEVPHIQTVEKIVEIPYIQTVEKIVEVPTVGETMAGFQKTVTVNLPVQRQEMPTEYVQEMSWGPPLPSEQGQSTTITDSGFAQEPMARTVVAEPAVGGMSAFDQLDANHDGVLTRAEFAQAAVA